MKKKTKQSRRSVSKHPDLNPRLNLKTRYELYDQDYTHKLSPKELDWLNKFNKEFIGASLDHEKPQKNLHKTKKLRKDCYDMNNSRNRDVLTRAKASKQLADYEELVEEPSQDSYEDYLIEEMDKKGIREALDWLAKSLEKDEERLETRLIDEQKTKPQK